MIKAIALGCVGDERRDDLVGKVCLCFAYSCFNLLYVGLKSMSFEKAPKPISLCSHLFRENLRMLFGE